MPSKRITTEKAPSAIGPYSQGIVAMGFLSTAGQIPLDPESGKMVEGGIVEQTDRVMQNLQEVLGAAGANVSVAGSPENKPGPANDASRDTVF